MFVSMDGVWKLRFPHCMFPVKAEVAGFPALTIQMFALWNRLRKILHFVSNIVRLPEKAIYRLGSESLFTITVDCHEIMKARKTKLVNLF